MDHQWEKMHGPVHYRCPCSYSRITWKIALKSRYPELKAETLSANTYFAFSIIRTCGEIIIISNCLLVAGTQLPLKTTTKKKMETMYFQNIKTAVLRSRAQVLSLDLYPMSDGDQNQMPKERYNREM